jgi:hypothetical protein
VLQGIRLNRSCKPTTQGGLRLRGFWIEEHWSVGNLHIRITGRFNGMCAWELVKTIKRQPPGSGRVFVGTAGLDRVEPAAVTLFKSLMAYRKLPPDWLYFKGAKGFEMAPDGSRVLVCKNAPSPQKDAFKTGKAALGRARLGNKRLR